MALTSSVCSTVAGSSVGAFVCSSTEEMDSASELLLSGLAFFIISLGFSGTGISTCTICSSATGDFCLSATSGCFSAVASTTDFDGVLERLSVTGVFVLPLLARERLFFSGCCC